MNQPIRRGGVFMVPDQAISLPPNPGRLEHTSRPVIVVSGDAKNSDPAWKHVLVIPTSSSGKRATEFCVKLGYGVGNLPSKCWARTVMPQPVAKDDLGDYLGQLPPDVLETIDNALLAYMGLID